jgi:peptide/nickel transport system substrate-binding protein
VLLHVADKAVLNAAAVVTRQRLESIRFNVVLRGMDWATMQVARTRKEPPEKGGWNLFHTWLHGSNILNPSFSG